MILISELSVAGYMLAGLAFVVLTSMLLTRSASRIHSAWLMIATSASALWGFVLAYSAPTVVNPTFEIFVVEILHDGFWLLFLSMLLGGAISQNRFLVVRFGGLACTILIFLIGTWAYSGASIGPFLPELGRTLYFGSLLTSLFVFVALEQIYLNARPPQRIGLKYLCLGVGAIFAYDIILYSNAILSDEISIFLWDVRGVIVLMCVPLIGGAVMRGPSWLGGIFVSRHVVYYTTTMFLSLIYLVIIGVSGYYIRMEGEISSLTACFDTRSRLVACRIGVTRPSGGEVVTIGSWPRMC